MFPFNMNYLVMDRNINQEEISFNMNNLVMDMNIYQEEMIKNRYA